MAECRHHWLIVPPNGHFSLGKCKHCGAEKQFSNFEKYSSWSRESASRGAKKGAKALHAKSVRRRTATTPPVK